jgi:undecaprenyl phosphate-alpha-L-ara4N flippase subunit ArnE
MSPSLALWMSIVLGSCAQIFLKKGVDHKPDGSQVGYARLLRSGWVWLWAFSFVFATALWLVALAKIELSYAFPLLSSGYVIVAVLSMVFLKERISWMRWMAIFVISLGVATTWGSR